MSKRLPGMCLPILVTLVVAGMTAAAAESPLSRQWTIYVVAHPHVDIGYTEMSAEVKRNWCVRIDQAMAAAPLGFKWTLENSVLFDVYSRMRPPEKVAELARLVREGKIEVAGLYTGLNSEGAGPEELVRSTFYASDELRRKLGVVPKTAMLSDVAGATWGLPRVLAGSGIRYFAFAPGRYKELFDLVEHPELFYWKSPDGSKVLTRLGSGKYFFYGSGVMLRRPKTMEQEVAGMLRHYEALGKAYPYDAVMLQDADDNTPPPVELLDIIKKWNAKHANPRMVLATPSEFFQYVESKYQDRIPELSGDFTSAWTDMMGNYAEASGIKRAAASRVLAAERFAVLAELLHTGFVYPQSQTRSVYENLLRYTDHTHGISTWLWEHDVLPQSGGILHSPVWDFYKESWEAKKQYAYRAAEDSDDILGNSLERLAAKIPTRCRTIVVFNSLSWSRTDVVRILSRLLKVETPRYDVVDTTTGERIPYQVLDWDARYSRIAFIAKDVPALGYKTYRVQPAAAMEPFASSVARNGNVLENEFYRVEVDLETGGVRSIVDKQLGRELADTKGAERINQYFHYSLSGSHEALYNDKRKDLGRIPAGEFQVAVQTPRAARIVPGYAGPVLTSLRVEIRLDQEPATEITQEVILYPGIKRIDFSNRIRKQATLGKEEVYYSFPFQVDDFRMHVELSGAVIEPHRDQLPGSFTGYNGMQHWADVSNRQFGVTVATREAPVIELGEIRTNDWSVQYEPQRSAFFFYVMNNRWNTNQALWQGNESWRRGVLELNFAVTSHRGDWRDGGVTRFGWQHNMPLVARVIEAAQEGTLPANRATFSDGLPENVILQALKKAEDGLGYIARFYETTGTARNVVWSGLPMKVRKAYRTDLVERNIAPARVEDGKIGFPVGAYQLVTLRLVP
jgi:alpha-mannosidase